MSEQVHNTISAYVPMGRGRYIRVRWRDGNPVVETSDDPEIIVYRPTMADRRERSIRAYGRKRARR